MVDDYTSRGRRLLPDVCGYLVSLTASIVVCSEGDVLRLPNLAHYLLLLGFSDTDEVKYNMRMCRTKFGIVTHIFKAWQCSCLDILLWIRFSLSNSLIVMHWTL